MARLKTRAAVNDWIAVKFSALMRRTCSRIPVNVADISDARCTMLGCWYLSITACKVAPWSDAAVAKVSCALALGLMRTRTAKAHIGSSPVFNANGAPASCGPGAPVGMGNGSSDARGVPAV